MSYRDRLAHTPQKLSKDEVIAYILIGLPESWSTISTIIENQPLEAQTLDSVINTLNTHERKLATQATHEPTKQPIAFVGRHQKRQNTRLQGGRPSKRSKSQDSDEDQDDDDEIECWYCLKRGHLEKDCRLKKQADKKRIKRQKQEARANAALAHADKATSSFSDVEF